MHYAHVLWPRGIAYGVAATLYLKVNKSLGKGSWPQ
jgi:hypothetical protein